MQERHMLKSVVCISVGKPAPRLDVREESLLRLTCACEATIDAHYSNAVHWWTTHIGPYVRTEAAPIGRHAGPRGRWV